MAIHEIPLIPGRTCATIVVAGGVSIVAAGRAGQPSARAALRRAPTSVAHLSEARAGGRSAVGSACSRDGVSLRRSSFGRGVA
ncbi:MAG: hypothetical protein KatS3mg060_2784 [Dehalococcoidia bacterium]|nr:MAG: hypothetical protein KatS3mg060_2784 [Dehalococcoidia bacterium]